ncbi:patatin family protein [Citroniella saccharovorans]
MIIKDVCLILEGGGIRSSFTSGILDYFLEKNIIFENIIATSASSFVVLSYMSEAKKRLLSFKMLTKDAMPDINFMMENLPVDIFSIIKFLDENLKPIEFENIVNSKSKVMVTTTNADTGLMEYFNLNNSSSYIEILNKVSASCSLPFYFRPIIIKSKKLFDGGFSDGVPIIRTYKEGFKKILVVSTRPYGYRKEFSPLDEKFIYLKKYPRTIHAIENRFIRYNDNFDFLDLLIENNKALLINLDIGNSIDTINIFDYKLCLNLYNLGYEKAKKEYINILNLIKE